MVAASEGDRSAGALVMTVVLGGAAATIVWESWARLIAPYWIGAPLDAAALIGHATGMNDPLQIDFAHYLSTLLVFPVIYLFAMRPMLHALHVSWFMSAVLYGLALWGFALYFLAFLGAGQLPFLGFSETTWAWLVGCILYGLALGSLVSARDH